MPGYSIDRGHRTPKTIYTSEPGVCRLGTNHSPSNTIASKETGISGIYKTENETERFQYLRQLKVPAKNTCSNTVDSKSKTPEPAVAKAYTPLPTDAANNDLTKTVCKQARASQHLGMIGLSVTLFSFLVWLALLVLRNSGYLWAVNSIGVAAIITGVSSGILLALLAIIFAISAFHKIHAEREKYTGTSKAFSGIIFALILVGVLAFLAISLNIQ